MLAPDACSSLDDVRAAIDTLDFQIVQLLGQRLGYVRAAARFKPSQAAIPAPERQVAMLEQRRRWAADHGLNPDMVAEFYTNLIRYFIGEETSHWSNDPSGRMTNG